MFSTREIIDLAIRIEENGEAFYRKALQKSPYTKIHSLFQWLAEEEVKHRDWLDRRKSLLDSAGNDEEPARMGSEFLQNILGKQVFSLEETDLSNIKEVDELIEMAIEFERDTILFFEMMQTLIQKTDVKGTLGQLLEEEKLHIRLLKSLVKADQALDPEQGLSSMKGPKESD